MSTIFRVNQKELPWSVYGESDGPTEIRYKAMTGAATDVPAVQYIEYGPGRSDPVHSHRTGEVFIVTEGEIRLDGAVVEPGGVVYIPPGTDYAVTTGDRSARYFRIVVQPPVAG